jgi:hypothetical protein
VAIPIDSAAQVRLELCSLTQVCFAALKQSYSEEDHQEKAYKGTCRHDGWATAREKHGPNAEYFLCTVDELPDWHFRHRGLRYGYRYCASAFVCAQSLFRLHNETINIWSHLLAALCTVPLTLSSTSALYSGEEMTVDHVVVYTCVILGNLAPMGGSAFAHTFYCMNKDVHDMCWFADYVGVITGELFGMLHVCISCMSLEMHVRMIPCVHSHRWNYNNMAFL